MDYSLRGNNFGGLLKSPQMDPMLRAKGEIVAALYRLGTAHRTGELATSVRVSTQIGGIKHDRREATVTTSASYAASHEFGTTRQKGFHELRTALEGLGNS